METLHTLRFGHRLGLGGALLVGLLVAAPPAVPPASAQQLAPAYTHRPDTAPSAGTVRKQPAATTSSSTATTSPSSSRRAAAPAAARPQAPAAATAAAPAAAPRTAAPRRVPAAPVAVSNAAPAPSVIDVQADSLSYDAVRDLVIADGAVRVTKGLDSVEADYAEVDTANETVFGKGNIVVRYQGNVWRGNETHFNFRTGIGDFGAFSLRREPYTLIARESQRVDERHLHLAGVILTTCEPDNPEYSVRAAWATLEDQSIIRAKHVRFQLGPVPFFYFPYIKANVHWFDNLELTPGYSSDHGAFLLAAYRHKFNDVWTSRTHLDIRAKRGVAVGEDILWEDPDGAYEGILRGYYLNDQRPWDGESEQAEREDLIEDNRYWVRFHDRHNLTDRDYFLAELNYVSDPWMLHDFFDDTYQKNVQPENRFALSHRGDRFTASIDLVARLNDFYSNVSRLPEVSFDVNRQQIPFTPFYYESESAMGFLKKEWSEQEQDKGNEDYDAFRIDTRHMVYLPIRTFGFLSIVPRGGYRGTYYSKTLETAVYTNVVPVTDETTGLVVGTTNEVQTVLSDGPSIWRNLPEFGGEASFSAFGLITDAPTGIEEDIGLRHVAEPYVDWTLRLEPNITPDELWYFDSVDELDECNILTVGMKNYLQTKRRNGVHNLVYADVYSPLNLDADKDAGEETFQYLGAKAELRPFTPFYWNAKALYDVQESQLDSVDTQAGLDFPTYFRGSVDYRFKHDHRDAIAGDVSLFPEQRWEARVYARVDLEESHVEEHSYHIIHRTDCLGIGIGVRIRPAYEDGEKDDYSIWFRFWPLAFSGFFNDV